MDTVRTALTIAGSDSGGGAGIQTDLKTFAAMGVYGMSVITAITAQNTQGVDAIETVSDQMVLAQWEAIYRDMPINAMKIGMLSTASIIEIVAKALAQTTNIPLVLDPVMVATSGDPLLETSAQKALLNELFPRADLITPNLMEALFICQTMGIQVPDQIEDQQDMETVILAIAEQFSGSILLKGGHLEIQPVDMLYHEKEFYRFEKLRINTKNTHGTGCTLSAAIASQMALGKSIPCSVAIAEQLIHTAIKHSIDIGKGHGPTNPMAWTIDHPIK